MKALLIILSLAAALLLVSCGGPATVKPGKSMPGYDHGLDFLKSQAEDGSFGDPGFSAFVATAFLERPGGVREEDRAFVDGLLDDVASYQKEDGGIYDRGLANYVTCASILALQTAGGHEETVTRAAEFVKSLQTESGGIGYSDKHPGDSDLSNTQFSLESLRAVGLAPEDPVFSKALRFLQRVQNRSESNDSTYRLDDGRIVTASDDGGAFYKPRESKAGVVKLEDGRYAFQSYGSMTYALLKCYLMAGVSAEDPRVQAAVRWIEEHFTLEVNPGFENSEDLSAGLQGIYYYYFTMAKALDLLGREKLTDGDGVEHDWRKELRAEILSRQGEDGSWVNEQDRWMEGFPVLATSYALITLSCCGE